MVAKTDRAAIKAAYEAVAEHGSVMVAAKANGLPYETMRNRYQRAMQLYNKPDIRSSARSLAREPISKPWSETEECNSALVMEVPAIKDGVGIVFSDCHWRSLSQPRSLSHEALLILARHIKPGFLFCNGDALDMGSVSRHPPLMWSDNQKPNVAEELAAGQTHLRELREAAGDPTCYWIRGNHDDRYDKYLAAHAAAFEGMGAFSLQDQFIDWPMTYRLDVGDVSFVHRYHGGVHAGYNNAMKAGRSIISGDTHALDVRPLNHWSKRIYGVQTGMLGDPNWPQFNYRLGIPGHQNQGFVVLTWRDGALAPPETCEVVDGAAWFRGQVICGRVRIKAGRG